MITLLLCLALVGQILNPAAPQTAYTTADPISPDRLGLATIDGRYSLTPMSNCDGLAADQEVLIYPSYQLPPWLTISSLEGNPAEGCVVRIEGRMSTTPCFLNDDGVCDVALESPEQ